MAKIATALRKDGVRKVSGTRTASQAEEIQKLSYQFFVERGYEHGHDQEDWLRAEAIVRSRRNS